MEGGKKVKQQKLMSDQEDEGEKPQKVRESSTGLGFVQTEKKKPGRKPKRENDQNGGDSDEEPASNGGLVKRSQGGYVKKQHQHQTHLPTPGLVQQPFKRKRGRPAKNEQAQQNNQNEQYGFGKMGGHMRYNNQQTMQQDGNQSSRSSIDLNDVSGGSGDMAFGIRRDSEDDNMAMGDQEEGMYDDNFEISGGDMNEEEDDGIGMMDDEFDSRAFKANQSQQAAGGGTENDFQKFTDKTRINQVYQAMNDVEQERFEMFRQSNFNDKQMKKILSMIPGTGKINPKVSAIIRSVAKIFVGQLVEEAKTIQIQEVRDQIEFQETLKRQQKELYSISEPPTEEDEIKMPEIGPIMPYHLMEARRRLMEKGELVRDKPKPMFPRRPRF